MLEVITMYRAPQEIRDVRRLYAAGTVKVRAIFGGDGEGAIDFYSDYLEYIKRFAPASSPPPTLLDAGCGCAWSSYLLAEAGYRVSGIDLNPDAFEPPAHANLSLSFGSILDLPFPDVSFDIVTTYQCLEHVPDPRHGLEELGRVLKPGGLVIVVGPNLVTPFLPLKFLLRELFTGSLIFKRLPSTPRHPYGNTAWEHLKMFAVSGGLLLRKLFSEAPAFTMRKPDPAPPFHGDNDACYLCNPIDLLHFFKGRNYVLLANGKPGRPWGSWLFAGGTWIAFRKAAESEPAGSANATPVAPGAEFGSPAARHSAQ